MSPTEKDPPEKPNEPKIPMLPSADELRRAQELRRIIGDQRVRVLTASLGSCCLPGQHVADLACLPDRGGRSTSVPTPSKAISKWSQNRGAANAAAPISEITPHDIVNKTCKSTA